MMKKLEEMILKDLTMRAFKEGKIVSTFRKEKLYFEMHYLPVYFANNFLDASVEELDAACIRLESNGFVDFYPTSFIKLKAEGANYYAGNLKVYDDPY